jgi:hypothetical protein
MRRMKACFLAVLVAILAACADGPPHSDYYVVFFDPTGTTLLPEGRSTLLRAARDARGGDPTEIVVRGYVGTDGSGQALADARMQAVEEGLIAGGVDKARLHRAPESVTTSSLAQLGSGIVVQIQRGIAVAPAPLKDLPLEIVPPEKPSAEE